MKKPTMIAAGVLALLFLIYVVLSGRQTNAPEKIEFEIPKYETLEKVEIVHGDKTVVLAREGEAWSLKAPVDYPTSDGMAKELTKLFSKTIGMDRKLNKGADASKYGLDKDTATVSFFAGGEKKLSIVVGKENTVAGTFVKRTWVKREGDDTIYRAKAGLRGKLVMAANDMRKKKLLDFKKDDVVSVTLSNGDKNVSFEQVDVPAENEGGPSKKGWKLLGGSEKLDDAALNSLANAAGRLRADGFEDGKSLAETGLEAPALKASFKLKSGKAVTLLLGAAVKEEGEAPKGGPSRYLKLGDAKWVYVVSAATAKSLDKGLADLRSKDMMSVEPSQVEKVVAINAAKEATEVVLASGQWKLVRPAPADASKDLVDAALKTMNGLKATRVPEVSAEVAGLAQGQGTHISVTLAGGDTSNLYIGKKVSEAGNDRYARVGATGPIFELLGLSADKILKLNGKDLAAAKGEAP
jgi:hypothetical protein